jgi:hypothetical protein
MKRAVREALSETAGAIYIAAGAIYESRPKLAERMTEYVEGINVLLEPEADDDILTDYERAEICEVMGAVVAMTRLPCSETRLGEYINLLTQILAEDAEARRAMEEE